MRTPLKWLRDEGAFGWNYLHLLKNPWLLPKEWYYHTKWFIQRGHRGWADCDAWSIDYYISRIMVEMLEAQYKDPQGTPMAMFVEGDLQPDGNPTDEACKIRHEQWKVILDKINVGFQCHRRLCDLDFWNADDPTSSFIREKTLRNMADEGLALFAKYFGNLWN